MPEALPANWYRLVRQQLAVQNHTQYNDPTIKKKITKRFAAEGQVLYVITIYQDDKRIREINHGYREPTAEEMRTLDCTPDPEFIARNRKKTPIEKLAAEAAAMKEEEVASKKQKEFEESKEGVNVNPLVLSP